MQLCEGCSVVVFLLRVVGININTAPLPRWPPTTGRGKETTITMLVMEERQELLPTVPLLLVLNGGVATLLPPVRVGCMEEKLAGEAMTPAGLLLITGDERHMMVMPSSLKISPSMVTKMKAWGTLNPTPRLAVVLFLVAIVIIMAVVIRMTVTTKRE